jgi:hypothetical protein
MYTPQMVVQGQIDVVGSQRDRVAKAIDIAAEHASDSLGLAVGEGRVSIPASDAVMGTVWLAAYDDVTEVVIERGENGGKTLTYHKSVRELIELGRYEGGAMAADLPLARLAADGRDGAAVLVQADDGAIVGAARVDLPSG